MDKKAKKEYDHAIIDEREIVLCKQLMTMEEYEEAKAYIESFDYVPIRHSSVFEIWGIKS